MATKTTITMHTLAIIIPATIIFLLLRKEYIAETRQFKTKYGYNKRAYFTHLYKMRGHRPNAFIRIVDYLFQN
jgi:hypothetical protein